MSVLIQQFKDAKKLFDTERDKEDGSGVLKKTTAIIDELGSNWNSFNGGELAERQMKLAGYAFYMADYLSELQRTSEQLKLEIKHIIAKRWDEVAEEIKSKLGKVQNVDQIKNALLVETKEIATEQILYETFYYKYKLKLSALENIITAVVQRVAEKKRENTVSKMTQ